MLPHRNSHGKIVFGLCECLRHSGFCFYRIVALSKTGLLGCYGLLIVMFCAFAPCGCSTPSSNTNYHTTGSWPGSWREREKMADLKLRDQDPSAAAEYEVAIAMASAEMAKDEIDIRDGIVAAQAPPSPSIILKDFQSYSSWRMAMDRFWLTLPLDERGYFARQISNMSENDKWSVTNRFSLMGGFERENNARALSSTLAEWRELRQAVARMRTKAGT